MIKVLKSNFDISTIKSTKDLFSILEVCDPFFGLSVLMTEDQVSVLCLIAGSKGYSLVHRKDKDRIFMKYQTENRMVYINYIIGRELAIFEVITLN